MALPTDRAFTGQVRDATGLDYFRARFYSPALGRFISADSIVPGAGNPQNLNRYAFVLGNPLKYTDSSGHVYAPADVHRAFLYTVQAQANSAAARGEVYGELGIRGELVTYYANNPVALSLSLSEFQSDQVFYEEASYARFQAASSAGVALPDDVVAGVAKAVSDADASNLAAYETAFAAGAIAATINGSSSGRHAGTASAPSTSRQATTHGNSFDSPKKTYLYQLVDSEGNHLKYGITSEYPMERRYNRAFMKDKRMIEIASGGRRDMARQEREMILRNPGPLNHERWLPRK